MNYQSLLARRTQRMHVNAIREILKVASQPGMISLAGGIPAPESFPLELMAELNDRVLATHAAHAFPNDFHWSRPEGGMFVWVEGPEGMDMRRIYARAVENGVAYVPGQFFFVDQDRGRHTLRLNFTMADGHTLKRAIDLLADVMRRHG